jgi:CRISPR-associated endonuclease/helicase Cas3
MTQAQPIQTGDPIIATESRTIFAHSLPGRPQSEWETLEAHAVRVAELARSFASAFGAADWGDLLGRWHDLGKRSDKFQEYIRKSGDPDAGEEGGAAGRVDHSTFGAQHAAKTIGGHLGQLLAFCVAGHHGSLPDDLELNNPLTSKLLT